MMLLPAESAQQLRRTQPREANSIPALYRRAHAFWHAVPLCSFGRRDVVHQTHTELCPGTIAVLLSPKQCRFIFIYFTRWKRRSTGGVAPASVTLLAPSARRRLCPFVALSLKHTLRISRYCTCRVVCAVQPTRAVLANAVC